MRKALIAALGLVHVAAADRPASAANLISNDTNQIQQQSAFAGARLRVPLGSSQEKARAGLSLTLTSRNGSAESLRFARGLELGFGGADKVELAIAGRSMSQLTKRGESPNRRKMGISTG